jgi:O-antigen biosynthesis protein
MSKFNPLDHPICFASPKRLTPVMAWQEHIPFAMFLVDLLRPRMIVELGTHLGDSYCAFCQAVKELGLGTRCYAIDTWAGDPHAGFYGASVLADLRSHHDPLYGNFSRLVQSTFDEALEHFEDETIGILHIDGYHTYDAVKHDFESWLPKVSKGGVILLHDINVRERGFGINKFWKEIKSQYANFEFLHGHGLGVLAVGEARSDEFRALLEATDEERVRIRDFFFQLGNRGTLRRAIENKEETLQDVTKRLAERETDLDSLQSRLVEQERKEQALLELIKVYEHGQENYLQLFWAEGEEFSEDCSIKEILTPNGQSELYRFQLPPTAQNALRLDPGNRPGYVEIISVELFAEDEGGGQPGLVKRWSADNDFAGLVPVSGIICLSRREVYRFICVDEDPQLLLGGIPAVQGQRRMFLEVSTSVSKDFQGVLSEEFKLLREEVIGKEELLSRRDAELANAEARLLNTTQSLSSQVAVKDGIIQSLKAQLGKQEQVTQTLESRLSAEHERFIRQDEELKRRDEELKSLAAALTEKEQTLESVFSQLADRQAAAEGLQAEAERHVQNLQEQIRLREQLEAERVGLTEQLAAREGELYRVKNSFGWRLLSRYGLIKYRYLLPLYRLIKRWLRAALEFSSRREYHPSIRPINDAQLLNGGQKLEATGSDPQFNVSGPWPRGWVKILIHIEPEVPVRGRARLYVDRGAGYNEADSYDLGEVSGRRESYVSLGPEVTGLRLDPFESAGRFTIKEFTLTRVSRREAGNRNHARGKSQRSSTPDGFLKFSLSRARNFRKENGRLPRPGELPAVVRRTLRAWNNSQANRGAILSPATPNAIATAPVGFRIPQPLDPYDAWLEVNQWNARRELLLRDRLAKLTEHPLLSVVMPVYNPHPEFLDKAIQCVARQVYQNWELCIADDASTDPAVISVLRRWAEREPRIRLAFRRENGNISRATNSAAELAVGEYLVLMDQDDEIPPDALGEVALYVSEHPETDVLYSDDDKINSEGQRFAPQFKPDWSPELLLSYMYFSHLFVLRRNLFTETGGLRVGYEGSQDYDLALRATEIARHVGHIPKILYHWRVLPGSTASAGAAKPDSFKAGIRAVQEALDRRGVRAKVLQPDWAIRASCGIFSHQFPDDGPRVAIIIPTKNNVGVLRKCVESIGKTTYRNYEVVIIDNESDDPATLDYLRKTPHKVLRIQNSGGRFSFAAINNRAVSQVSADHVLFLNNDTEVITPGWLSQMVGYLGLSEVGAVGARLLYPDGRIQHAGVVHGYYDDMVGPAFKLSPASHHGYLSYTVVARNYSAVTAACMLTRRDLFLSMGGFDEENFSVAYNDVDYCYRLHAAGHRIVYCPTAELIHHEGYSRGFTDNPAEPAAFRNKYRGRLDPYYNLNLSLDHERFSFAARTIAPETLEPIRTLMCAFTLNWEGAPYSQYEMTVRLKERGIIDPIVYCPNDGPLRQAYEAAGIPVEVFEHPLAGVFDPEAYDQAIESFAKRVVDLNVELVYGNTLQTFYAIDSAKRAGLPSVWNPRESEPWQTYFDYLGSTIAARALQCFNYPYKIVFVANATREVFLPLNAHHNFITVHNGPDRNRFTAALRKWPKEIAREGLGVSQDEIMILLLGTVCERKGQVDLVEAIAQIGERDADRIRCFVVGDRPGHYSERLKAIHQSLPGPKRLSIKIIPETSDTALYYSAADIFVCTSRLESFPRVILEAMISDLPIITTPVYGITEQVQEDVNALFYEPGNTKALAEAILRLSNAPPLRKRLAGNNRHLLDMLIDYESMVSAYGKIFREAWLSGRARACAE